MFTWEKKMEPGGTEKLRGIEKNRVRGWGGGEVKRKNETERLREGLRMMLKDLTWFYMETCEDQEEYR